MMIHFVQRNGDYKHNGSEILENGRDWIFGWRVLARCGIETNGGDQMTLQYVADDTRKPTAIVLPIKNGSIPETLDSREQKALTAFLEILHKRYPELIYHVLLFGSKARGESNSESDIDLLIVIREYNWGIEKEISRLATEVDYKYQVVLSDHMVSSARFEQMAAMREPLYCNLEIDGVDLWKQEHPSIT